MADMKYKEVELSPEDKAELKEIFKSESEKFKSWDDVPETFEDQEYAKNRL